MSWLLAALPKRFQWTIHNVIAHPLSELLFQVGMARAGDALHDATVPVHERGSGRG